MQIKYKFERDLAKNVAAEALENIAKEIKNIYQPAELPDFEEALNNITTWDDFLTI